MSNRKAGFLFAAISIAAFYVSCVGVAFADHIKDQPHDWFLAVNIFFLYIGSFFAASCCPFLFIASIGYALGKESK
jgi:hypothetical protein